MMEKHTDSNKSPIGFRIFLSLFALVSILVIVYSIVITGQGWKYITGMFILGFAVVVLAIIVVKMLPKMAKKFLGEPREQIDKHFNKLSLLFGIPGILLLAILHIVKERLQPSFGIALLFLIGIILLGVGYRYYSKAIYK